MKRSKIDMMAQWLYNRILLAADKENSSMNLDSVLEKVGASKNIQLVESHPCSVSILENCEFFIKPMVKDIICPKNSKIILFSAPGATGKSALAKFISYSKKALLWDLSKEKIANHSFSGMLVESLGTKLFSAFTNGLETGDAVLVIDALDEAEMISGRVAIETLLADLRAVCINSICPNIILCARTETAHFIKEFYSKDANKLEISHYEISFFEETNAIEFIKAKIAEKTPVTPATELLIKEQFARIKQAINGDESAIKSFLGYAPVLEALAVYFVSEPNTMKLLQSTQNSTKAFCQIMDYILTREKKKVVDGFKQRCQRDFPTFHKWNNVYSGEEQIKRLADYIIFNSTDYDNCELDLPNELSSEYGELIESFLKDHPFVRISAKKDSFNVDFAGVAFRDFILAKLMNISGYDDYAKEYFSSRKDGVRCPSSLFFDFYQNFSEGNIENSHFQYLYESFKAKEVADSYTTIDIEEDEDTVYYSFKSSPIKKRGTITKIDFVSSSTKESGLRIKQINNAYIDISGDIIFGSADNEDVTISNTTIKCRKILLDSTSIMLIGEKPGETLLAPNEGFEIKKTGMPKFEVRTDELASLKISSPDIHNWYKLSQYEYNLLDESNLDLTKFENAVKNILKYFRKHGKDAPGRHFEFIKNIIIGGSPLKQSIHDFFIEDKIFYKDSKDPKQYKLNMENLEKYKVNWGSISQSSTPNFKPLFDEYSAWTKKQPKKQ